MNHPIYKVVSFQILKPYALHVWFDDGTEQEIDFQPVLGGELYRPLRDVQLFEQVVVDPEVHTLVWPNGADFDPAILHDWPPSLNLWQKEHGCGIWLLYNLTLYSLTSAIQSIYPAFIASTIN